MVKVQAAINRGVTKATTMNNGTATRAPVRNSDQTLLVSPAGAVFRAGAPLYANPSTPFYAGTRFGQVPSPSFQKVVNPTVGPNVLTATTNFSQVGGAAPMGGFSTAVSVSAAGS